MVGNEVNEPDSQVSGESDPMFWPEEDVIAIKEPTVAWLNVNSDPSGKATEATVVVELKVHVKSALAAPEEFDVERVPVPFV